MGGQSQHGSPTSAGNMGKALQNTMQHASERTVSELGLPNASKAFRMLVMQCRCSQHWYLQPQTLPAARMLSILLGF